MAQRAAATALLILLISYAPRVFMIARDDPESASRQEELPELRLNEFPITVRPGTLAAHVDSLAGQRVRLPYARVVGVFDPRVFLIESQTRLLPLLGNRNRVLVFIEAGTLRIDSASLVASTVTVSGIARTLLGMQVTREVPWPAALTRDVVERLEIRAAVLARSVRTPEGVDLLIRSSPGSTAAQPSSPGR